MQLRRVLCFSLLGLAACGPGPAAAGPPPLTRLLVYTRTAGFAHDSIEAGVHYFMGASGINHWYVISTDDPGVFAMSLGTTDVIVFLSTTGDVLADDQEALVEQFVENGGGFVGVHAAADSEYEWLWYGKAVGAYFASHPAVQEARIEVVDREHPSTAHLAAEWRRTDEWYDYRAQPEGVRVLMTLDEESYTGGKMGAVHPIAWCREVGAGRAFYTGLGHTKESFSEPAFQEHLAGAILWAARHAD